MDEPREPEELSRSDLRTIRGALRNDWPIPDDVKRMIVQAAINIVDPDDATRPKPTTRTRLAAMKVLGAFAKLNLGQAAIDLAREKLEGKARGEKSLADAVAEAEKLAEERIRERECERGGGGVA